MIPRRALATLLVLPLGATGARAEEAASPCLAPPRTDGPGSFGWFVFFAPHGDALSARARQVLDAFVTEAPSGAIVLVQAHLDAAEAGDADLDRRRGEAVRDYLAAHGLVRDLVHVEGFGFTRPLVPTHEAEAQNRRVQLVSRGEPGWVRRRRAECAGWLAEHCVPATPGISVETCRAALRSLGE